MTEAVSITALADATAARLRLLQANFADEELHAREEYMVGEIRDAMTRIVPEQRNEFLESLQARFPAFNNAAPAGSPVPAAAAAAPARAEPQDPLSLAAKLVKLTPALPADKRQAVIDQLRPLIPASEMDVPEAAIAELIKQLQLGQSDSVGLERVVHMLTVLVDFAMRLDQAVWNTWTQIDPQSEIRRPGLLQRSIAKFIRGEQSRSQVQQDTDKLLKLTASLMVSLQRVAQPVYRQFFDPLSPQNIEQGVGGGMFRNKEAECWKKFRELAAGASEASFGGTFHKAVAKVVKELFPPQGLK